MQCGFTKYADDMHKKKKIFLNLHWIPSYNVLTILKRLYICDKSTHVDLVELRHSSHLMRMKPTDMTSLLVGSFYGDGKIN